MAKCLDRYELARYLARNPRVKAYILCDDTGCTEKNGRLAISSASTAWRNGWGSGETRSVMRNGVTLVYSSLSGSELVIALSICDLDAIILASRASGWYMLWQPSSMLKR